MRALSSPPTLQALIPTPQVGLGQQLPLKRRAAGSARPSHAPSHVCTHCMPAWHEVLRLSRASAGVRALHRCDNVDTPSAMRALLGLVRCTNAYMNAEASAGPPRPLLVLSAAKFVTRILVVLGVAGDGDPVGLGGSGGESAGRQETLAPVLDALCGFRDSIRCGVSHRIPATVANRAPDMCSAGAEWQPQGACCPGAVMRLARRD